MTDIENIFSRDFLLGKKIVVVGASSGIGGAVAADCAKLGAHIIAIGRQTNNLEKLTKSLQSDRGQTHTYIAEDISTFEAGYSLFSGIRKDYERIDGVIWTAGTELIKPARAITSDDVLTTFGAANFGLFGAMKAMSSKRFWPGDGGSVVVASSVSSLRPNVGMSVYSSSRAALSGAIRAWSLEMNAIDVRVNSVVLGAVQTEMHERITKDFSKKNDDEYRARHLRGYGTTSDVTPMILFLLGDASSWITGSEHIVDGGYLVR